MLKFEIFENSPKGLSYRLFKENFEFEHYLDILPDKDRITYCRFRTGNHRLPIETTRDSPFGEFSISDLHFCWNWSNIFCFKLTLNHFGFTFP
jgi:hypothetical protein